VAGLGGADGVAAIAAGGREGARWLAESAMAFEGGREPGSWLGLEHGHPLAAALARGALVLKPPVTVERDGALEAELDRAVLGLWRQIERAQAERAADLASAGWTPGRTERLALSPAALRAAGAPAAPPRPAGERPEARVRVFIHSRSTGAALFEGSLGDLTRGDAQMASALEGLRPGRERSLGALGAGHDDFVASLSPWST